MAGMSGTDFGASGDSFVTANSPTSCRLYAGHDESTNTRIPLLCRPAAVDHHCGAGHQRGRLRGQEHDRASELLELAETAELDLRQHFIAKRLVLEEWPRHRGFQEGRTEAVHADVVWRELDRHRLGETLHGVLAGAVDGAPRCADMAHLGGHVDERARLLRLDQAARHRLRHEERRPDIERKDEIEVLDLD